MERFEARAWTADWLNAWLASIGVAVLVDDVRIRWSATDPPRAIFELSGGKDLPNFVASALPTAEELMTYGLSKQAENGPEMAQRVTLPAFRDRAKRSRLSGDFSFAAAVTDNTPLDGDRLVASPFNPPANKGITLWERLRDCVTEVMKVDDVSSLVERSMTVGGERVQRNGLGFDYRRFFPPTVPQGGAASGVWVDPVVEVLAFLGLSLIPIRGNGRREAVRGWHSESGRTGVRKTEVGAFKWPAWSESLNLAAIDALLDRFWAGHRMPQPVAVFEAVPHESRGSADNTRGFASRRVR